MDGLDWVGQQDFSGGAFPLQERVPASAVEDCTNGLTDDDGSLFKRGGGVYKGSAFFTPLVSVADLVLAGGQRTLGLAAASVMQFAADDSTVQTVLPVGVFTGFAPRRVAVVGGVAAIPFPTSLGTRGAFLFAGSRKGYLTVYSAGTVAVTQGSRVVTGTDTSFSANADAGMLLAVGGRLMPVASVDSNTQVTLALPWPDASASGQSYTLSDSATVKPTGIFQGAGAPVYVASVANRLLMAADSMVTFSAALDPHTFGATDYHTVPSGMVTGLQSLGTDLLVFTTSGIYRIANLAYDLTDALGNVQQSISPIASDVILWGDQGIAGVDGAVLVPAVDDLYTISGGGVQKFDAPGMRKQWRAYVKAGYTLGNAAVHRGRYFLPILDSTGVTLEDVLVLRLDTGAWTRWSGHSAGVSFAQRGATATTPPKLFAAKGTRIVDNTGCFEPSAANKLDADGSTPPFQVIFRTVQRHTARDLLRKFRVRVELDDAGTDNPTLTADVATGRPGSAFTTLTGTMAEGDGTTARTWSNVNRRGQEFRAALTSTGPSANLRIRSVEYGFRPSGRQ